MTRSTVVRVLITVILASVVGWGILGDSATDSERAQALATQVACPVCENSVADSQATYARNIRSYIATKIEAGESDREILDGLAASFGEDIILDPPARGVNVWLFAIPAAAVVAGAAGIASMKRRGATP